ncbi:hypothetical protein U1Q18_036382 [Sarracenia purpurea var. burkii]
MLVRITASLGGLGSNYGNGGLYLRRVAFTRHDEGGPISRLLLQSWAVFASFPGGTRLLTWGCILFLKAGKLPPVPADVALVLGYGLCIFMVWAPVIFWSLGQGKLASLSDRYIQWIGPTDNMVGPKLLLPLPMLVPEE